jgi:hypothetical protein
MLIFKEVVIIRYRILDANADMEFGKGQQNFTYGTYAVTQAIKTRLKLLKGEWWESLDEGLPLFQSILGQNGTANNLTIADVLIKERIVGTQDVTSIESFSSTYDSESRSYSFTATVNTKYGTALVETTL